MPVGYEKRCILISSKSNRRNRLKIIVRKMKRQPRVDRAKLKRIALALKKQKILETCTERYEKQHGHHVIEQTSGNHRDTNETKTNADATEMKESVQLETCADRYKKQHGHHVIEQTSVNHRDTNETETNANATEMKESVCDGNSNEQPNQSNLYSNGTTIEMTDNTEIETKENTPNVGSIQNHNSTDEVFQIHSLESETSITETPKDLCDSPKDARKHSNVPSDLDSDEIPLSSQVSQGNQYSYNITGRISLDEMRKQYTVVIHASEMD